MKGTSGAARCPAGGGRISLAGRYTLERELGRGGHGHGLARPRCPRHDRPVALKVLHPELNADLGPERFLREIRTTALLDHPHIIPLLDSRELGVHLLTGTVRWVKDSAGQGRVQVSPELVQVATASTKWQEPFDAPLTDVFKVQADVATRASARCAIGPARPGRSRHSPNEAIPPDPARSH